MEAALFCEHSANNAVYFHKDFDATFEMAFIDTSKSHRPELRINQVKMLMWILLMLNLKLVDRNMLKQSFTTRKRRSARVQLNVQKETTT